MRNDKKTSNDPMTPAIIIAGVAILIALIVGAVALLFIRNNEGKMKADVSYTEEPDEEEASVFPWKNKDKETGSVNEDADLDDKDNTGDSNDEPDSDKNDDSLDNKVLVCSEVNEIKGDDTSFLQNNVISRQKKWWSSLHKCGLISDKKYANLQKSGMGKYETMGFLNRQQVETRKISNTQSNFIPKAPG